MILIDRDTDCCGSGCVQVHLKFTFDDMKKLKMTYTQVDNMSDKQFLNTLPAMLVGLGYGAKKKMNILRRVKVLVGGLVK